MLYCTKKKENANNTVLCKVFNDKKRKSEIDQVL